MAKECTLSQLIDKAIATNTQYRETREKLLAYQQAEQALNEKYAAYFKELSELKALYQVDSLQTVFQNTGTQSLSFTALSIRFLVHGICTYYAGLSSEEQEKLDEEFEREGIEFCCPDMKYFGLTVQEAKDNDICIVRDNPNSAPDVILEAKLPLDQFFHALRCILPAKVFTQYIYVESAEE